MNKKHNFILQELFIYIFLAGILFLASFNVSIGIVKMKNNINNSKKDIRNHLIVSSEMKDLCLSGAFYINDDVLQFYYIKRLDPSGQLHPIFLKEVFLKNNELEFITNGIKDEKNPITFYSKKIIQGVKSVKFKYIGSPKTSWKSFGTNVSNGKYSSEEKIDFIKITITMLDGRIIEDIFPGYGPSEGGGSVSFLNHSNF